MGPAAQCESAHREARVVTWDLFPYAIACEPTAACSGEFNRRAPKATGASSARDEGARPQPG